MDIKCMGNNFWKNITTYFNKDCKNIDEKYAAINDDINNNQDGNKKVKTRTLNFMISSALVLSVLHPLDIIRTRKQIYKVYKNSYPYYYNNKYNLFYILKKEKIESVYRGLLATLITTGASHGIFRFIYDTLNYYVFQQFNDVNNVNNNKRYSFLSRSNDCRGEVVHLVCNSESDHLVETGKIKTNGSCDAVQISFENSYFEKNIDEEKRKDEFMISHLSNKIEINEKDNTSTSVKKDMQINSIKNMNHYIITSSVSSIISVFILHPIWLVKTKIECTINLNHKFLNYKSRITSKHYNIFVSRNKMRTSKKFSNIAKLLIVFGNNFVKKDVTRNKIKLLLNKNMLKCSKNSYIYNRNIRTRKKYNHLVYTNDKKAFLNKSVKRKMVHNYLLYKYYTISNLERKQMTKKVISNHRKFFFRRYLLYLKYPLCSNKILRLFKREESKNAISIIYNYKNYFHFVYNIYKKEKLFSFYKGFLTSILLTPHVAIQFYIYEYLTYHFNSEYFKNELKEKNIHISLNTLGNTLPFLYGVTSKFIAVMFTYPLYTIKMRQQVQMKNYGFLNVVVNIFKLEGIKSFYTGLNMHLLRNCLQNGLLFFIFEYLNAGSAGSK
ncbi:mitochondrial carrier protein [Plasmodium gonderi]|uniref:Mitochondrial carrier protein n=1 Tax=Plasmodium gonderi TaxID=77519 RepID=A0A1Y1JQG6_PLAGO|nr:mitochondrial carrier protein [Plasmodium gonderi]GAW83487.1 mitochondrial carrier protein [Plasmodium gonderi]